MSRLLLIIMIFFSFSLIARQITNEIYINSNNIYYDKDLNLINLGENSLINFKNASIKTNDGIIDVNKKEITINGDFYLNYSNDIMKGELLKADLNFNEGSAKNVNYIFDKELKINSKYLKKNKNNIFFHDSFLTRCDLKGFFNCPTWSLKVKKTRYSIEEDFFEHFNTFIQIADKKIFYMPYFSHYGSKAERQKGFLTPSAELINKNFGGNITLPYYIPINDQRDIKITPTIYYEESLTRYFKNKIEYRHRISEGNIKLTLNNFYDRRINGNINKGYTIGGNAKLNLNEKNNIDVELNYTSNVSKYKSDNDSKATTMNSNIKLNSYNFIRENDILITRISGSKDLSDKSNTSNPYELPSIEYNSYYNFKNNIILNNDVKINIITRSTSSDYLPTRIFRFDIGNVLQKNYNMKKKYNLINKLILNNTSLSIKEGDENTNIISGNTNNFAAYLSSEINKNFFISKRNKIKPRIKVILSSNANSKITNLNDNSQSLSFNYNNIFKENKYYGSDKKEEGSRIVIGLEQNYDLKNNMKIDLSYGAIYNIEKNNNYMDDINQNDKLSDHLTKLSLTNQNHIFAYSSRHDNKNFDLKEDSINYTLDYKKNKFKLKKNLTNKEAYINSKSSNFMTLNYNRLINKNINFNYENEIDFKNRNKLYSQKYELNFSDECSTLSFAYLIENYDDGNELKPNKKLSIKYEMDF